MGRYLAQRLVYSLVTLLVVSMVVFVVTRLSGDPVRLMLPIEATQADVEEFRHRLGLDRPLLVQYGDFLWKAMRGDLGESLRFHQPALTVIVERLPATAQLALAAILFALIIAFPAGIISATKQGSLLDHAVRGIALLGQALPAYWVGIMLIIVFAVQLHWLPAAGGGSLKHLVLPGVTLGLWPTARISRVLRSSMLEVLGQDYVRTARGKGLRERSVILAHAMRNALLPVITVIGLSFGLILGGAIITETVFAWPGVGRLLLDAVYQRDYPLVQAIVLFFATIFLIINLVVDLLYAYLDPRIRLG
ncbi:MAG: ABC transporter permease [Chloroflexi bacterium]|nr:ABC transporter permease [Chloroflexota bacterium]